MSYLAIGAVTKAIAELLEKKLNKPQLLGTLVPKVTTLPPDDDRVDDDDGVNLFLYRVSEDPFTKNMNWRGDKANPTGARRPPLSLRLHYLLTSYAQQANNAGGREDITAHQLLGNAMAILHEHPVLNDIHDADFDADLDTQFAKELRDSFEKVKITLMPESLEELSKIWTGLNKGYRLSVGYEVSLVQIAPTVPTPPVSAPVQQINLEVDTFGPPVIVAVEPPAGPAGAQITLKGTGFKARGRTTLVGVGEHVLAEADLLKLTEDEIVLTVPETLQRGPRLGLVVVVGERESLPAFYEVSPWINSVSPLRGFTGLPLEIPFEVPAGATVSAEIAGAAVVVTVDAARGLVRAVVPAGITTNGPKPVVLIVNDGAPRRSNARLFELLPQLETKVVTTSAAPARTTIALTGQRLNGSDVSVRYGRLLIGRGENLNATQLGAEVSRILPTDLPATVIIDGRESNTIPPLLDKVEPPAAFAGDDVTLSGHSLSGQNVVVSFGASDVNVGAHAAASRLTVGVPPALAAGAHAVKVTVNGNESNTVQFEVLA